MSVRISLVFAASLFLVACGNSDASAATHGAAPSASTNWSDDRLDATKVDYYFSAMEKLTNYAIAHPDVDLDAVAMDGSETEADYAKRMNADPKLKGIFTATGIDPLRYANVTGVMTGTMFGVGLAGKNLDASKLPQAAQYYLAHKAQIDSRMAAFQAKEKALITAKGGDDSE
jgi:ABC-type glycerol-3-phosphate transport system substrate-binding protein